MQSLIQKYKSWRYKNSFILVISLFLVFYLAETSWGLRTIEGIEVFGYLGSFFAGIFFVSTFTVVPASIVLFKMAQVSSPLFIAFSAGVGAVIGDYIIFRFLKDRVFEELEPVFLKLGGSYFSRILSTPYFAWLAPVLGAIIIASPFPDEIGVGLMGISKLKNWQFVSLSFVLNSLGILIIVTLAK